MAEEKARTDGIVFLVKNGGPAAKHPERRAHAAYLYTLAAADFGLGIRWRAEAIPPTYLHSACPSSPETYKDAPSVYKHLTLRISTIMAKGQRESEAI